MNGDYAFTADELSTLDPASYVPLYMQLAQRISALIGERADGAVGKLLPSEIECAERLQISRPTVRQAMARLLSQGLIMREKGRGTFVAPTKLEHDLTHAFEDDMQAAHQTVEYGLLEWRAVTPPPEVSAVFGAAAAGCFVLRRTRSVSGQPIGVEERYLPAAIAEMIAEQKLEAEPLLALVARATGLRPGRLDVAVGSVAADKALADILGVKRGIPLLQRTTTFVTAANEPLVHGTVTFRGDRYTFRFSVNYAASTPKQSLT
jgi:GntR family transcriptional regulator